MSLNNVRDYLKERLLRLKLEWKNYSKSHHETALPGVTATDADLRRDFSRARNVHHERELTAEYQHNAAQTELHFRTNDKDKNENFEFFELLDPALIPENRLPNPGIELLPLKYHKTNPVYATDEVPETGFQIHPLIKFLIKNKYPQYLKHIIKYVRPLGTTDATFSDFNREQKEIAPLDPERKNQVLRLVNHFLGTTPYLPLHYVDHQFAKLPLHTGTGYHNRHHYKTRTHAVYSHPEIYSERPTSKGYFINSFLEQARTIVHRLKEYCLPFSPDNLSPNTIKTKLKQFFLERPTILFTRNHISDRDGALKQRPVYAVDDLFLVIEVMLTFPLLVLARKMDCCIMYGLETIRGGNHYLDWLSKSFRSFFTIDWSAFDQRVPRVITDLYYTDFLESLIVINHGYQPTYEYPTYPDLTPHALFTRMDNLLHFLHTWYNNMVFVTADGYAYLRTSAGVPSGLYNTQYLDSFANLYLLIDGMLEFGFSEQAILQVTLFVMGDDNSGFTDWQIGLLHRFISWFELYANNRYNMKLSTTKSVITMMRNRIETLSYSCNFGNPIRPIPKLVAQLCYPEHGPNMKYMSARAIGISYAACGMNSTFHDFCRDVYLTFLPYSAGLTDLTMEKISKHLPGQFKMLDAYFETIDLTRFPTIHEVRRKVSQWDGPLDYSPKWNYSHFVNSPNVIPPDSMTMAEYRIKMQIPRRPVATVFEA